MKQQNKLHFINAWDAVLTVRACYILKLDSLQNARQQKGYLESLIRIGDTFNDEAYTHR